MPSTVKEKLSHQSILIKTAGKPLSFGISGKKVVFASPDKQYQCYTEGLFGEIVPGNTIDADVEVRESGEFVNNVVTQIYKDSKPVSIKKTAVFQRPSGKTPEEIGSIENQVRAKIIAELWIGKAIDGQHPLAVRLIQWLNKLESVPGLHVSPAVESKPEVKRHTVQDLIDISKEKGYDSSNVSAIMISEFKKSKASELESAQRDALYGWIKEGKFKVDEKK